MNEKTISLLEEMSAQAQWSRDQKMIETFQGLLEKSDNEISRRIYQNAIRLIREGYRC